MGRPMAKAQRPFVPLTEADEAAVNKIIKNWRHQGQDANDRGWPAHPELVFRMSGEWKGWNHLLGIDQSNPNYPANDRQDWLEGIAYERVVTVLGKPSATLSGRKSSKSARQRKATPKD